MVDYCIGIMVAGLRLKTLVRRVLPQIDGLHPGPFRALNVRQPVVADEHALSGRAAESSQDFPENFRVRLHIAQLPRD